MTQQRMSKKRPPEPKHDKKIPEPKFHLVVPCRDETDQRDLYEELRRRGYRCRVLTV